MAGVATWVVSGVPVRWRTFFVIAVAMVDLVREQVRDGAETVKKVINHVGAATWRISGACK